VADKPTRGKHYRSFQNDRCGLPKDQDADGAEHETDQKSDGRIERPSRGRDESEPLSGGSR